MKDCIDFPGMDPRLGYPSHHDWSWVELGEHYGDWVDAAYETIPKLVAERDEALAALAELVRLKAIHDEFDGYDDMMLTNKQLAAKADYRANKPKAWARAREIINKE